MNNNIMAGLGSHLQARHFLNGSHQVNIKPEKKIKYKMSNMNPKSFIKTDHIQKIKFRNE